MLRPDVEPRRDRIGKLRPRNASDCSWCPAMASLLCTQTTTLATVLGCTLCDADPSLNSPKRHGPESTPGPLRHDQPSAGTRLRRS